MNPVCPHPHNPAMAQICQTCRLPLLLANRYRLRYLIGAGGSSRTFLATDGATDQSCVVKQCLSNHLANLTVRNRSSPESVAAVSTHGWHRFRQEAQRLDILGHHPQIPQLLDVIEMPDASVPAFYLVQEWIEGQTLEAELAQFGPWDEEKGRSLLFNLLPVLQFIHDHQVIHRDIKPENIIRSQADGTLILVDFGAAKQTSRTQMGQTGTVIGSAGYAAPEQTMGQAVFASDLYSLGVTCLHLLTGMHPFELYSVSQDDWVWSQYMTGSISPSFVTILNRMICRAANQRYRTATAALTDLSAAPGYPTDLRQPADTTQSIPNTVLGAEDKHTVSALHGVAQYYKRLKTWVEPMGRSLYQNPLVRRLQPNARFKPAVPKEKPTPPWTVFQRSPHRPGLPPPSSVSSVSNISIAPPASTISETDHSLSFSAHVLIHPHSITALAIAPDGTTLASGDNQGTIVLWHLPSVTRSHEFPAHSFWQRGGHRDRITALQFSSDGVTLFSSSADSTIKQWDIGQLRLQQTLTGEGWGISTLAVHPDGALLVSGGTNGAIDLWNVTQGQFIQRLWNHTDIVTSLAITADGVTLFSGSADGLVYCWDLRTAEAIASIRAHYDGVVALRLHHNGQIIVTSGGDRTLRFWDMTSLKLLRTVEINLEQGTPIAIHFSGCWMATAHDETHIQLWQLAIAPSHSIHLLPICQLPQDWTLTGMVFGATGDTLPGGTLGDRLVSGGTDGTIKVWIAQPKSRYFF